MTRKEIEVGGIEELNCCFFDSWKNIRINYPLVVVGGDEVRNSVAPFIWRSLGARGYCTSAWDRDLQIGMPGMRKTIGGPLEVVLPKLRKVLAESPWKTGFPACLFVFGPGEGMGDVILGRAGKEIGDYLHCTGSLRNQCNSRLAMTTLTRRGVDNWFIEPLIVADDLKRLGRR